MTQHYIGESHWRFESSLESNNCQRNCWTLLSLAISFRTENRALLVAQTLLELTAKLIQQANYLAFCENAVAHHVLACWRNWTLGKKAGLLCQTALVFQSPVAHGFCWLQCIEV